MNDFDGFVNSDNKFVLVSHLMAEENNVSLETLNKIAKLCRSTNNVVQWRLDRAKKMREKWIPLFANKLEKYLRRRMIAHPIEYTGKCIKVVNVQELAADAHGAKFLDTGTPLFSDDFLKEKRLAFTNICLLAHEPSPFVAILFMSQCAAASVEIKTEDYTYLGDLNEQQKARITRIYGDDPILHPGRYFIDLNLATKMNPIVIGQPIIHPHKLTLCIAENYSTYYIDADIYTDIVFDPAFLGSNFTHMIIHFNTVDESAYKWDEYGLTYNDSFGIENHAQRASFIRRRDDPMVDTESIPRSEIIASLTQFTAPPGMHIPNFNLAEIDFSNQAHLDAFMRYFTFMQNDHEYDSESEYDSE